MRFMGGAVVFPGGAVAPADLDPRWSQASGLTRGEAAAALHEADPAAALGAYVCALRESFEEVGLLLGIGAVDDVGRDAARDAALFLARCLELGVVLSTDDLVPAGRWITPQPSPIRFDTRFFIARVPDGWEPEADPAEVDDCYWSTPGEALATLAAGRSSMAPPTIDMLTRLAQAGSVGEALRVAAGPRRDALVARLSPLVTSVLAPNPGLMTGPGTNTYVVGRHPTCVIDPGSDDPAYLDALASVAGEVEIVLVTHRHADHVGGVAPVVTRTEAEVAAFGPEPAGGVPVRSIADLEEIEVGGSVLRALHTPGHAPDHLCFVLEDERALFAGDNVMGEGTPVISPPEGNMRAYLDSLRRLEEVGAERIYPGHFRALDDAAEALARLIAHRLQREAQILGALERGPRSIEAIVTEAYSDVASELHGLATRSTRAHLEFLEEQGKARRSGQSWEATT
jgi:glyoxylase-like metal-dependent hydrolase (beta-lactamase superfamily II)/8-oxo-dGTP pyrophosphatase MutT (NUDIX family)